jgi:two-component system sensor kinase FixL
VAAVSPKTPGFPLSRPSSGGEYNRLETLLKNLPGMAYRCLNLKHWPMDFVSDGCYELCGYHRHEIESQRVLWGDFTHPDMIGDVDRVVREAAAQGEAFEVEYRIIARDGTEKWVWERGRVVDYRDDGIAILEGFITDINNRVLAEAASRRAEAYAQAIVDTAMEAVITVDEQGAIESFNQSASDMFGYRADQMAGHHFRRLVSTRCYADLDRYFQRNRGSFPGQMRGIELDGCNSDNRNFPVALSIRRIPDIDDGKYVILIRDLSGQRRAERVVREQRDLLAHVDRLNTLGEMAAGIAHEINQPLTTISMYAQSGLQFLQRPRPDLEKLGEALTKLSQQAHRAGAVIERMQAMTRPHQSRRENVDTFELLSGIRELAEVEARLHRFIIHLRLEDQLPEVDCDPIQIQQVILNLLRNGMESMSAANCTTGSRIVLQAGRVDDRVRIAIIDCGIGVSPEHQELLYRPFASTKESGMGLGLKISRSIIGAHGGRLEFANNRGSGATFSFELAAFRHG